MAGDQADAARSGMPEHDAVLGDVVGLLDEIAHRHALQHHRRRRLIGDGVRYFHEPVSRDEAFLGIASNRPGISDAVTNCDFGHAWPDRDHLARALAARREGKGRLLVEPGPVIDIDVIHAGRILLDLGLARPWLAGFHLFPLQDFGAAISVNADRVGHSEPLLRGALERRPEFLSTLPQKFWLAMVRGPVQDPNPESGSALRKVWEV